MGVIDYPAIHRELFVSPMRVQDRCHQFGVFVLDDLGERQIESLVEHFRPEITGVYKSGTQGHPANQDLEICVLSLADRRVRTLAKLLGGRGTMNVPSWSRVARCWLSPAANFFQSSDLHRSNSDGSKV